MLPSAAWQKVLAGAAATASSSAPPPNWNITHLFGPSLSSSASIFFASDTNYSHQVTQPWTRHAAPSFVATIQPATVGDVQNIVKIAAAHKIPFLTTGGGHGLSIQMAQVKAGLQIDLQNFQSVRFDPATELVTVGGAVKFQQLIAPLYSAGYQFPLGTAYCVGVVGSTLGAGVSANQGYMGLLIDLLEEVQLVTSDGGLVTASRTQNEDLFWALRGAGANFGIVTAATYRVPRAVNRGLVTNVNYLFPSAKKAGAVWKYLAGLDQGMAERMALNIATFPGGEGVERSLVVNVNYAGPLSEAAPHLAAISALKPLRTEVLEDVAWPDVFRTSYFGVEDTKACSRNQHVNMRSVGAKSTPDVETILAFLEEMERFSEDHPDLLAALVIHRFATQKVLDAADDENPGAYPHRDLKMHIQLEIEAKSNKKDKVMDEFLDAARQNFTKASGYDTPVVYVNFAHGDEGPAAWYGKKNLGKLAKLKKDWDPKGLFSFYDAVASEKLIKEDM